MLFLRGLRWRRGFSAAVLLVGIISAAVAAIGPLYARASSESTLTDELHDAGSRTGLAFAVTSAGDDRNAVAETIAQLGPAARVPGYGKPIPGRSLIIRAKTSRDPATVISTMVWRSGECAHIVVVTGRCPTRTGEAIVPEEARAEMPTWSRGASMVIRQGVFAPDGIDDGPVLDHVTVVGTYRARNTNDPYWFGHFYFGSALGPAAASVSSGLVDAIFVAPGQFTRSPPAGSCGTFAPPGTRCPIPVETDVDFPLVASRVHLADVAALRRNVAAVQKRFPDRSGHPDELHVTTQLTSVLRAAARDKHDVETATLVVVLELAALSLLVLFQVVSGAVEARGDEIALAKLRGLRPVRTIAFALREPVVLLLAAAPLGLLVAWVMTHWLAMTALAGGTPVRFNAATWLALAAAFGGSAVAAGLAAIKTVTRPVLEQWRNTSPPRHGTKVLLAVDIVLAAVAVATATALRADDSSRPRPVFLLAPALIVFAVALVGVRLLPRLGRLGLAPTRSSRHIAAFLALRQTVRRTGGLRLAALLAVAAGLATFAICGEAVARGNRAARAQTELGAPQQLSVQFEAGAHDPQTVVDKVDPQGRWAMTTATWSPEGGPTGSGTIVGVIMGVEPSRLPATAYAVRGQLSPTSIDRLITAPSVSPALFKGTKVRVRLTVTQLRGDHSFLEVNARRQHALSAQFAAGTLRLGTHDYTATVPCALGCAFTGITFDRSVYAADLVTGSAVVHSIDAYSDGRYTPVTSRLSDISAWRSSQLGSGAAARPSVTSDGLSVDFLSTGGSSPILLYADSPAVLPIVATHESTADKRTTGGVYDFTGALARYDVQRWASPLPAVLATGAIADLDYLRYQLPNFDREATWTVWLGPNAPSDAVARLQKAGLIVQQVSTESARAAELGRQGPALGLLLLLVCAIAAAVLAVGGTAVALLADARRRSFELAALRVVGVEQRTLRRSAIVEQVLLLGAAIALGLPSGYVAAALVLPVVPEFSDATPVVLRYSPPVLIALACVAAFAVLLWVTALIAGSALARGAVPARLREAAR